MTAYTIQTRPPVRIVLPETKQVDILIARLAQTYSVDPSTVQVVKAPLRICPLGAHIDHQLAW